MKNLNIQLDKTTEKSSNRGQTLTIRLSAPHPLMYVPSCVLPPLGKLFLPNLLKIVKGEFKTRLAKVISLVVNPNKIIILK
jgi:hypothetical protein